jgi:DNA-3-methyladenine glycosylase
MTARRLGRTFYARPSHVVAPELLGAVLRYGDTAGRIVEVEAYGGADDAASHAYRGPTPRNEAMFGPAGHLYVYFIYGMYFCANVVTGRVGNGEAVLLRAVVPLMGLEPMRLRRPKARSDYALANGPGKLCGAFGIDRSHDGLDLVRGPIGIWRDAAKVVSVIATPRIGITKEVDRPWRWLAQPETRRSSGGLRKIAP